MSYADKVFKETCIDILTNGTDTKGEAVRPKWEDGEYAYTIKKFGVVNKYDLREEFPAITLRRIGLKSCFDEILWIYQKKSSFISQLKSHIWDQWADSSKSIGKAYGYQIAEMHFYKGITEEKLKKAFDCTFQDGNRTVMNYPGLGTKDVNCRKCLGKNDRIIAEFYENYDYWRMDQMDKVLYDLVNTPFSRRIMTTTWNPDELYEMNLEPCAYSMTYNVTEENGELILNAVLNQRSQDMLAANGWNTAQYALLLMMVARHVGMTPGVLMHVITDCHIYDRHIDMVKRLLDRDEYPAPKVSLNPEKKDFYDFTVDDLIIENYQYGEQIKNIPIAV